MVQHQGESKERRIKDHTTVNLWASKFMVPLYAIKYVPIFLV